MPTPKCSTLTVRVTAPSRLHFGLLSFGAEDGSQYGGVGAMIDRPGVELIVRPVDRFEVVGHHRRRTRQFAKRCLDQLHQSVPPPCRIEILSAAPQHVGLGTGTQLALAVCTGLLRFLGSSQPTPEQLAALVGRGRRSSVGTHGFSCGGLLYEELKPAGDRLAPLEARVELPTDWRWLLVRPEAQHGLHGEEEMAAFGRLPGVALETVALLRAEARDNMLPAARSGDFAAFSESIFRYGVAAGSCFAEHESAGPFATTRLAELVDQLQRIGIRGVGQSSWGPTIFALCASQAAAEGYLQQLSNDTTNSDLQCMIAAPNNIGASIEVHE